MAPKSMKSRRRKNIYKDFQKVKLKAGKTLPKGLNVTDASFKSRQIQIREQLGKDSNTSEPKSHRQLSLTTLLSQLEHYNANIRCDAVLGLQQIVQTLLVTPILEDMLASQKTNETTSCQTSPILQQHLGTLVARGAALVVDRETTVRQAALKLFQILFSTVSPRQVAPFFKMIIVHVCCAMTHIEERIQLDSLKFVDLLVVKYPELVAENSSELLPHFIGLIARRAQGQGMKSSLAINPALKLHARRWRTSVLDRLFSVLNVVNDHLTNQDSSHVIESTNQRGVSHDVLHVDGETAVYHAINEKVKSGDFRFSAEQINHHGNVLAHAQNLAEFVSRFVPLILQSWVECTGALAQNTDVDETLVPTMAAVVKVTALLCRCIHGNDVVSMTYKKGLAEHFSAMFPFNIEERKKKKNDKTPRTTMVTLNLGISEILCHVTLRESRDTWHVECREKLIQYLNSVQNVKLELCDVETLVRIIRLVLTSGEEAVQLSVLDLLCSMYRRQQFGVSSHKLLLHEIMVLHVLPNQKLVSEPCMVNWMRSLPEQLVRAGDDSLTRRSVTVAPLVRLMATLAPRDHAAFIGSLQEKLPDVIDLVINTPLASSDQRRFVELLYHVTSLNRSVIVKLLQFCRLPTTGCDVISYLLNVIHTRMSRDDGYCDVSDYLSLLMSLCTVNDPESGSEKFDKCSWEQHRNVVKTISEVLLLHPNYGQTFLVVLAFFDKQQQQQEQQQRDMNIMTKLSLLTLLTRLVERMGTRPRQDHVTRLLQCLTTVDITMVTTLLMDVLEVETEVVDENLWVTLVKYEVVYKSCLENLRQKVIQDTSPALTKLLKLVSPVSLKLNVRDHCQEIREILITSQGMTSQYEYQTIRRQIEFELSLAPR